MALVGEDEALVGRVAAGDETALARLYDRYGSFLYSLALRVLCDRSAAEDVVQDVFIHVWTHADRFDAGKGSVRAWLGVMAHRRSVDRIRRDTAAKAREERDQRRSPRAGDDVADAATQVVIAERVRAALSSLPPEQRAVVELAYFHGRTFRQVATELGIPEGTAKSRIRLGLSKLAAELTEVASWT
jgi:RNA polymerase sigma-70 factor (ECF subfamily)